MSVYVIHMYWFLLFLSVRNAMKKVTFSIEVIAENLLHWHQIYILLAI